MKRFSQPKFIDNDSIGHCAKKSKTGRKIYSDTIYTFDIETTSLFKINGEWRVFDYDLDKSEYLHEEHTMMAIPYIWQFGVEDAVYYGRDFMQFEEVLKLISNEILTKIIWIHNASFELQFLQNIFDKYTITDMCARDIRKPISFYVPELNIEFRCSYMLTNLSLEKASEEYTNVKKKHTLDYDGKCRTEKSKLTRQELSYCEYDIICLYNIIKFYRNRYKHLAKVPLTATSEVRKALQKRVDYSYIKKQWDLVPSNDMYLKLMACFQGGYTHANVLNSGRVFDSAEGYPISSYDLASSYPTVMLLERYPSTPFRMIDYDDYLDLSRGGNYCFIMRLGLHNVKSRYYNNYLSYSRALEVSESNLIYDNGRIQRSDYVELYCTNIDLEIIQKNYQISKIDYIEIYCSEARYLDYRVLRFILDLYKDKTELKGVDEKSELYKKAKAYINSLY